MPTHAPGSDFSSRALTHTARRARRPEAKMGMPASVRVVLVAVVWCALACGAVAHARSADDWLRDWLGNLRVDIPDQVLKQGGLSVALTDLSCGSFEVGSLRSETNVSSVTASLDVNGAACACSGRWEIRSMSLSGRLAARVNDSDVAMTVALSPGGANASLPSSAEVTACSARVRIADLDFKGSGANVLRALVPLLKSSAESGAASAVKSALAPLVADKVTAAMRAGDERIAFSLVPHEPLRDVVPEELVPPMETKNAFDWRAEPAIAAARIAAEAGGAPPPRPPRDSRTSSREGTRPVPTRTSQTVCSLMRRHRIRKRSRASRPRGSRARWQTAGFRRSRFPWGRSGRRRSPSKTRRRRCRFPRERITPRGTSSCTAPRPIQKSRPR